MNTVSTVWNICAAFLTPKRKVPPDSAETLLLLLRTMVNQVAKEILRHKKCIDALEKTLDVS